VNHQPGSCVVDTDLLFKPFGGTSSLVCAYKKDCPEPFPQLNMRSVKYRIYRNRGLMSTVFALKYLSLFQKIGFSMTALRTGKSIWPSKFFQILKTSLFSLKTLLKLKKTYITVVDHVYLQLKSVTTYTGINIYILTAKVKLAV